VVEAVFTVIGTVIGTLLGFFLSEWSQTRRERRTGQRQAKSVRLLLHHEVATNLNLKRLAELWERIVEKRDSDRLAMNLWPECERLERTIREGGNPIWHPAI